MGTVSDSTIAAAAAAAGFSGSDLATAVAVALAESGGNPDATHVNGDGSTDYGLWQINSVHADLLNSGQWSDPGDNAAMARSVWGGAGGSFKPWTTYADGAYLAYLPRAEVVSGNAFPPPGPAGHVKPHSASGGLSGVIGDVTGGIGDVASSVGSVASGVGSIAGMAAKGATWIGTPHNWVRILEVVGGIAMLGLGLKLLADSGAGPVADGMHAVGAAPGHVAKGATKAAAAAAIA